MRGIASRHTLVFFFLVLAVNLIRRVGLSDTFAKVDFCARFCSEMKLGVGIGQEACFTGNELTGAPRIIARVVETGPNRWEEV